MTINFLYEIVSVSEEKIETKEQTKSMSGGSKARHGDLKQNLNQVGNKKES